MKHVKHAMRMRRMLCIMNGYNPRFNKEHPTVFLYRLVRQLRPEGNSEQLVQILSDLWSARN